MRDIDEMDLAFFLRVLRGGGGDTKEDLNAPGQKKYIDELGLF